MNKDIKNLYWMVAILAFIVVWIAEVNVNGIHKRMNDLETAIVDRIDLLSDIGEQNAKFSYPTIY